MSRMHLLSKPLEFLVCMVCPCSLVLVTCEVAVALMPLLIFCCVHRSSDPQSISLGRTTANIAPFPCGIWTPQYMVPWAHRVTHPNGISIASVFLQGSQMWHLDRQTNIHIDRPRYSVCGNRPHLAVAAMRLKIRQCLFNLQLILSGYVLEGSVLRFVLILSCHITLVQFPAANCAVSSLASRWSRMSCIRQRRRQWIYHERRRHVLWLSRLESTRKQAHVITVCVRNKAIVESNFAPASRARPRPPTATSQTCDRPASLSCYDTIRYDTVD